MALSEASRSWTYCRKVNFYPAKKYVTLSALRRIGEQEEEVTEGGGLLCGITAYHLRILVDNPWEGGAGYTFEQVANMTLDQIYARLCDRDLLKAKVGQRTEKREGKLLGLEPDKDGYIKGRAADGTPIKGKFTGKSLASRLREQAKAKAEEQDKRRLKRRRKRGKDKDGSGTS